MLRFQGLGLENFRVFRHPMYFRFSALNLLTGTNSSGKSSLFKALLLLQDSAEKNGLRELDFRSASHNLGSIEKVRHFESPPEAPITFTLQLSPTADTPFPDFQLGGRPALSAQELLQGESLYALLENGRHAHDWRAFWWAQQLQLARGLYRRLQTSHLPADRYEPLLSWGMDPDLPSAQQLLERHAGLYQLQQLLDGQPLPYTPAMPPAPDLGYLLQLWQQTPPELLGPSPYQLCLSLSYHGQSGKLQDLCLYTQHLHSGERALLYTPLQLLRPQQADGKDGNSRWINPQERSYSKTDGRLPLCCGMIDLEQLSVYGIRGQQPLPYWTLDLQALRNRLPEWGEQQLETLAQALHLRLLWLLGSRLGSFQAFSAQEAAERLLQPRSPESLSQLLPLASVWDTLQDAPLPTPEDLQAMRLKPCPLALPPCSDYPHTQQQQALQTLPLSAVLHPELQGLLAQAMKGIFQVLSGLQHVFNFSLLEAHRGSTRRILLYSDPGVLSELLFEFGKQADQPAQDFVRHWLRAFEVGEELQLNSLKGIATDVLILDKRGQALDLADLGYGISQLLPILLKAALRQDRILLIEEPETNLHPKMQSKLADLLLDAHRRFGTGFIVETHSEYLVRKLQYWVGKGALSPSELQLYYLYPPDQVPEGRPQVEHIELDAHGHMRQEFGSGFFDEADNLSIQLFHLKHTSL